MYSRRSDESNKKAETRISSKFLLRPAHKSNDTSSNSEIPAQPSSYCDTQSIMTHNDNNHDPPMKNALLRKASTPSIITTATEKASPITTKSTIITTKALTDTTTNDAETNENYSSTLTIPSTKETQTASPSRTEESKQNQEKGSNLSGGVTSATLVQEEKESPQYYNKKERKTIDIEKSPTKEINKVLTDEIKNGKTMSISKTPQVVETVSCLSVPPTKKIKIENKVIAGDPSRALNSNSSKKKVSPTNKRKRSSSSTNSSTSSLKAGQTSGRWTQEEHQAFLEGLKDCGREWKKVALRIPTRTSAQIRSHAQKYFSKLQRDQESSTAIGSGLLLAAPLMADGKPGNIIVVEGGYLSGTIVTSHGGTAVLTPSIQRNVERIVANPRGAQREVEDTLEALRERYRQLQQRLEDRRRLHEQHRKDSEQEQGSPNVLAGASAASDASSTLLNNNNSQQQEHNHRLSEKYMPLPINHDVTRTSDESSSVSSNVSSIAASRSNEEIIALEVLGDTLPRGDSANDLQVLAAIGENYNTTSLLPIGHSSIEPDGMILANNDNASSSSFDNDIFAPLPPVVNERNPLLVEEGAVFLNNDNNNDNNRAAMSSSVGRASSKAENVSALNIETNKFSGQKIDEGISPSPSKKRQRQDC
mmetsp:Transcript_48665/g.54211  ORF Transcript_48665/g.54211 Transcript_48665/m.54211 type:complete len:648 (+) Transcript_48665:315-2258(+)